MTRRIMLAGLLALGTLGLAAAPSQAVIPGVGVVSKKNMEWVGNVEQAVGSDIEFIEMKQPDGSLKRYALTGSMGNGMNIVDITNPDLPLLTGVYVNPGLNWQGDIQVNAKRKIAVISIQSPGTTVNQNTQGIELVDISNPALPTHLSAVTGLSAHNSTIIDDSYIYVSDKTVVDYSNASAPVNKGKIAAFCGIHDITVDPNRPNRAHFACPSNTYQIWDTTNPAVPVRLAHIAVAGMSTAHQADPSVDSSFVAITNEQGGGLSCVQSPCGGLHIYDISGKYKAGASETNPIKLGMWFAPFTRPGDNTQTQPWGNNTAHNMTFQSERQLMSIGWYTVGSWVADMSDATNGSSPYAEYNSTVLGGPTTWGNTQGNILLEGDEVWSTKWARFDDPKFDRYLFTNGLTRGMDVLRYTGSLPKKLARLKVSGAATGGTVSGKLDRYAVYTFNGLEHKPLAGLGKAVTVRVGGQEVSTTTAADGSFSATLNLAPGTYTAVVTWEGDASYQRVSVNQQITA